MWISFEYKLANKNKYRLLSFSIMLKHRCSPHLFANGEIDIALSRNDGLSCLKVTYIRYCEIASSNIRVSPCTPLHTMIIIRVELDRRDRNTRIWSVVNDFTQSWNWTILCAWCRIHLKAAVITKGRQMRRGACRSTVQRGTNHLHFTCSHQQPLFCNPAICSSTASYN